MVRCVKLSKKYQGNVMVDDPKKLAVKVPGEAIDKATGDFIERVAGRAGDGLLDTGANVFQGVFGDRLREWRVRRLVKGASRTLEILKNENVDPSKIDALPESKIYSIFEGMSLEEESPVSEMWSNLLASAVKEDRCEVKQFSSTLKALEPCDARVLQFLASCERAHFRANETLQRKNRETDDEIQKRKGTFEDSVLSQVERLEHSIDAKRSKIDREVALGALDRAEGDIQIRNFQRTEFGKIEYERNKLQNSLSDYRRKQNDTNRTTVEADASVEVLSIWQNYRGQVDFFDESEAIVNLTRLGCISPCFSIEEYSGLTPDPQIDQLDIAFETRETKRLSNARIRLFPLMSKANTLVVQNYALSAFAEKLMAACMRKEGADDC